MSFATAADLPAELIDKTIRYLDSQYFGPDYNYRTRVNLKKKDLGNISLTCRHWARRCRPRLFRHIQLETRGP